MLLAGTSKRDLLTLAFAGITLVALVVAAFGAVNYNRYYPAITQIQTSVVSLNTTTIGNIIEVQLAFTVKNPTDYQGLSFSRFESTYSVLYVMSPTSNVTAPGGNLPYTTMNGPLSPGTIQNVPLSPFNITANPTQSTGPPPTKIVFFFQPHFVLSSFLNKVTMVIPTYECTSSGDPTTCDQTGLTLVTAPGGQGGGGGGGGGN